MARKDKDRVNVGGWEAIRAKSCYQFHWSILQFSSACTEDKPSLSPDVVFDYSFQLFNCVSALVLKIERSKERRDQGRATRIEKRDKEWHQCCLMSGFLDKYQGTGNNSYGCLEPCGARATTRVRSSKVSLSSVTIFVHECLTNGNASLTENIDRAFSIGLTKGYTTKMACEWTTSGLGSLDQTHLTERDTSLTTFVKNKQRAKGQRYKIPSDDAMDLLHPVGWYERFTNRALRLINREGNTIQKL